MLQLEAGKSPIETAEVFDKKHERPKNFLALFPIFLPQVLE